MGARHDERACILPKGIRRVGRLPAAVANAQVNVVRAGNHMIDERVILLVRGPQHGVEEVRLTAERPDALVLNHHAVDPLWTMRGDGR